MDDDSKATPSVWGDDDPFAMLQAMKDPVCEDLRGPSAWYKMKKRPKHLPQRKLDELKRVVAEIRARHDVEMVILFGSHARGNWVEDAYEEDDIHYEYHSDFDILIVMADKAGERDVAHDTALIEALLPGQNGTRVNYIVHTIQYVNQMLSERRYFFMDILKDGYQLYDSGRYKLARPPKELPPAVMLKHAREYFEEWTESGDGFIAGAKFQQSEGRLKIAAFDLHQAAERYITCLLLVHTGYRPKEHDMAKLLQQGAGFAREFHELFPNNTQEEQHLFGLLRRAYVDARYSRAYQIDDDEFDRLSQRVLRMKQIVDKVCRGKIEALQAPEQQRFE
jgi:uncharacterized protein